MRSLAEAQVTLNKLIFDMSSEEYHGTLGTYSSSQFKDLLDDPVMFYKKYISKEIGREHIDAFDLGTYVHTGLLEPDKLKAECTVYPGKIRRGVQWDKFRLKNKGKTILNSVQYDKGIELIKCVKQSRTAMKYITSGKPEVSLFVKITVFDGDIYCNGFALTKTGWVKTTVVIPKGSGISFIVKVRADILGNTYVFDLKTTTGNARSERSMRDKISYYNYDLSAALYLDVFSVALRKVIRNFFWTFVSKDYLNCRTYQAHEDNILIGRAKWRKAVLALAYGIDTGWEVDDSVVILKPNHYEYEHIAESAIDLL